MHLAVLPCTLDEANAIVRLWHRHHDPVVSHRFSLAACGPDGRVVGVAIAGRPTGRGFDPRRRAEVTRLATDETPNACSCLYAAAARTAQGMGFERIHTYILASESGASLRAAGWEFEATVRGGAWIRSDGSARSNTHPLEDKQRWGKQLNAARPRLVMPESLIVPSPQLSLEVA